MYLIYLPLFELTTVDSIWCPWVKKWEWPSLFKVFSGVRENHLEKDILTVSKKISPPSNWIAHIVMPTQRSTRTGSSRTGTASHALIFSKYQEFIGEFFAANKNHVIWHRELTFITFLSGKVNTKTKKSRSALIIKILV